MTKPIVLCGEAMGENEARIGAGFVGASGVELLKMLDDAGALALTSEDRDRIYKFWNSGDPTHIDMIWRMHPEFHRTNVFQLHPPANRLEAFCGPKTEGIPGLTALIKGKYVRREYAPELERLADELVALDPHLIICLGNTPLWALCGITAISKNRGTTRLSTHLATGFKVLPTYHPAAILRQWENRPTVVADFMKAVRESAYPEVRRPDCEIWIEPSLEDMERFYDNFIAGCDLLSVDIETSGNQITCIGFAPDTKHAICIPFFDRRTKSRSYWPTAKDELAAWAFVRRVLREPSIRKLFQNGLYDIAFLWRANGIATFGAAEDSMLLHHALQPESLKGLAFLGSIYTDHGSWKQERQGTTTIKRDE